jgi:hypothetical protein
LLKSFDWGNFADFSGISGSIQHSKRLHHFR